MRTAIWTAVVALTIFALATIAITDQYQWNSYWGINERLVELDSYDGQSYGARAVFPADYAWKTVAFSSVIANGVSRFIAINKDNDNGCYPHETPNNALLVGDVDYSVSSTTVTQNNVTFGLRCGVAIEVGPDAGTVDWIFQEQQTVKTGDNVRFARERLWGNAVDLEVSANSLKYVATPKFLRAALSREDFATGANSLMIDLCSPDGSPNAPLEVGDVVCEICNFGDCTTNAGVRWATLSFLIRYRAR